MIVLAGRGDYFHETRELWDPATGEYLRVTPAGRASGQLTPGGYSAKIIGA